MFDAKRVATAIPSAQMMDFMGANLRILSIGSAALGRVGGNGAWSRAREEVSDLRAKRALLGGSYLDSEMVYVVGALFV